MSGLALPDGTEYDKGSIQAMEQYAGGLPPSLRGEAEVGARQGMTPLIIARSRKVLGLVFLKDVVKPGIRDRIRELRLMGIRTIMCTGDNRLTAEAVAREAGSTSSSRRRSPRRSSWSSTGRRRRGASSR